jgi:hypothetical protein
VISIETGLEGENRHTVVNVFERRSRDVGYNGEVAESVDEAERMLEEEDATGF